MKIAYLYNRPTTEGEAMDCEQTFADYDGTNRAELISVIQGGAVRDGDTLCIRAQSDLGQGAAIKRHLNKLEEMGVTVQIMSIPKDVRLSGRPKRFAPSPADKEYMCNLWFSPAEQDHVLEKSSERMGYEVKRDKLYYVCGPRDGSKKREFLKEGS